MIDNQEIANSIFSLLENDSIPAQLRNKLINIPGAIDYLNEIYPGLNLYDQFWRATGHEPKKCEMCGEDAPLYKRKRTIVAEGKRIPAYKIICSKECNSLKIKKDIKEGKRPAFKKEDGGNIKDNLIKRYGDEEGLLRFEKYKETQKKIWDAKTQEEKDAFRDAGKNSHKPNKGTPLIDLYINKYGEELGNQKYKEAFDKQKKIMRERFTGENNPQFGKPSSNKAGKGWKGWYHSLYNGRIFFRSLMELSFIINYLEANNIKWETGEYKKYIIPYNFEGKHRNYFPDFITNKYIFEIKPFSLRNTSENISKRAAASLKEKEWNKTYKVMTEKDFQILDIFEIEKLVESNIVNFDENTYKKYSDTLEKKRRLS